MVPPKAKRTGSYPDYKYVELNPNHATTPDVGAKIPIMSR